MNKILFRFLENSILELDGFNKIEFIIKMMTRLNCNYNLFSPSALDTKEQEINKSKIRKFINEHKILDKDDITNFIKDNINCWDLKYLKEFINKIDLDDDKFYYNDKDCTFVSLADYYDNDNSRVDEDINILFALLKDIM